MSRRNISKKRFPEADSIYNSYLVSLLITRILKSGKKTMAKNIVYQAFDIIKTKTKTENPVEVFDMAIKNVGPLTEIRSRRIGGANYQVPREVKADRRLALAMRWIIGAARAKKGSPMSARLADEIIAAASEVLRPETSVTGWMTRSQEGTQ